MAKIAVVGAGLIGRAWAISFARAGHDVALWDVDANAPAAALTTIETRLAELAGNGLLDGGPGGVVTHSRGREPGGALEGATYMQENSPERVDLKRELFAQTRRFASPEAVLASSTSAILPSAFSECLPGRARALVAHPINPPYLIPAVEIVPAPWTSAERSNARPR